MKLAATRQIYDYWNELRGERSSPERGEIDPAAIRGALADTFILDVDEDKAYPFRLSGTRTNAIFTRDLKGCAFVSLWSKDEEREIRRILAGVCNDVVGAVASVEATFAGRDATNLELLLLPVRYFGKTHARLLGCLALEKLPRWIGLIPPDPLRLFELRILNPVDDRRLATQSFNRLHNALSYDPLPKQHGHFLVYEGGKKIDSGHQVEIMAH